MSISSFKMKNSENSQGSSRVISDYYVTDRERCGLKFRCTEISRRMFLGMKAAKKLRKMRRKTGKRGKGKRKERSGSLLVFSNNKRLIAPG